MHLMQNPYKMYSNARDIRIKIIIDGRLAWHKGVKLQDIVAKKQLRDFATIIERYFMHIIVRKGIAVTEEEYYAS